ncbi:hypothetical protein ACS0TY_013357 [Phlomoides rotata]
MGAEAEKNQQESEINVPKPETVPTPNPNSITEAQFAAWKRRKDSDASTRNDEAARKRADDIAAGLVQMNGRELFEREPWVFDNAHY